MLRTKQAAKLETHHRLINVPVIDQMNSGYPHDFLSVFTPPNPSPPLDVCARLTVDITVIQTELLSYLARCTRVRRDLNGMLAFPGKGDTCPVLFLTLLSNSGGAPPPPLSTSVIEILHLISEVSLPRFGLPARIYSRLTLKVI